MEDLIIANGLGLIAFPHKGMIRVEAFELPYDPDEQCYFSEKPTHREALAEVYSDLVKADFTMLPSEECFRRGISVIFED